MNRDFFVRLAFAAYRVADALPKGEEIAKQMRETATSILADLLLLGDREAVRMDRKRDILARLRQNIFAMLGALDNAKRKGLLRAENFSLLESEYGKIQDMLEMLEGIEPAEAPSRQELPIEKQVKIPRVVVRPDPVRNEELGKASAGSEELSNRQRKIIEFLKAKDRAQVRELQKILPEVTKRTLRRDLDELLQKNLVARKGEWNMVSYELT